MKSISRIKMALVITMLLAIVLIAASRGITPASAQSGGSYDLTWNTFNGGGVTFATGGSYSLGGTIGQADAGTMSGGTYTLLGGFWVDFLGNKLNLPLILR